MKKTLALLLCLLTAVMLLASCGGKTPEKLIEGAFERMSELDAFELEMVIAMEVSMEMMGETETQSMPLTISLAGKDLKSETPKILMEMSMSMEDETMTATAYMEGEWMYATADGESYKFSVEDMSDMGAMADYSQQFESLLVDFPEAVYSGVTVKKNGDGSKTVALSLTAEQFESIFSALSTELGESIGVVDEGVAITYQPATVEVTVKGDLVSAYKLDFAMNISMDLDGDTATTEDVMSLTFSVGYDVTVVKTSGVTVTPPAGYQDFEEIPMY